MEARWYCTTALITFSLNRDNVRTVGLCPWVTDTGLGNPIPIDKFMLSMLYLLDLGFIRVNIKGFSFYGAHP